VDRVTRQKGVSRGIASLLGVSAQLPDPPPQAPPVEIEGTDATRRTRLANERTYLAWWRTGLASIAVGVGAGKVIPELGHHEVVWPYTVAGAGFTALGVAFIVFGVLRQRVVEDALHRGDFVPPGDNVLLVLTFLGAAFGILLLVVVLFS
jgi:putative membrane protein